MPRYTITVDLALTYEYTGEFANADAAEAYGETMAQEEDLRTADGWSLEDATFELVDVEEGTTDG